MEHCQTKNCKYCYEGKNADSNCGLYVDMRSCKDYLTTKKDAGAKLACSDGLDAAFLTLRGAINMVANALDRDAKEKPVRGEMAEQLRNDFGKFAELLEKEAGN